MTTLTTLLFGSTAAGRAQVEHLLGPAGRRLLEGVSVSGFAIEPAQVSGPLLDLLDQPLAGISGTAWAAMAEVRRARQRTLASPGAREVVALGRHTISSRQEPTVEATFAGAVVPVLHLVVDVEIEVTGVRLVVEGGEVIQTAPGQARARATVTAGGAVVAEHAFEPVDLAAPHGAPVPATVADA